MRTTLNLLKLGPGGVLFWERSSLPSVNHHTRNQPFASSNTAIQQRNGGLLPETQEILKLLRPSADP